MTNLQPHDARWRPLVMRILLFALAAMIARPAISHACGNRIYLTTHVPTKRLAKAEKLFEAGLFTEAKAWIAGLKFKPPLQRRAEDIRAVGTLRMSTDREAIAEVAKFFRTRSDGSTHPKYRAWLGEALAAVGQVDEARTILMELHERDLIPDAYGYLALARISSGANRYNFWKACRVRAKTKWTCDLPSVDAPKT